MTKREKSLSKSMKGLTKNRMMRGGFNKEEIEDIKKEIEDIKNKYSALQILKNINELKELLVTYNNNNDILNKNYINDILNIDISLINFNDINVINDWEDKIRFTTNYINEEEQRINKYVINKLESIRNNIEYLQIKKDEQKIKINDINKYINDINTKPFSYDLIIEINDWIKEQNEWIKMQPSLGTPLPPLLKLSGVTTLSTDVNNSGALFRNIRKRPSLKQVKLLNPQTSNLKPTTMSLQTALKQLKQKENRNISPGFKASKNTAEAQRKAKRTEANTIIYLAEKKKNIK